MKAQAYPPSVIRKGAVLYAALYYISDDDKAKVEVTEWIVRSIQKRRNSTSDQRYVNLAQKLDGITGKRSRKNGDFGWLPSIPSWCLKQFREGGELPLAFIRRDWPPQVCESQLAGRGPILRGRAEKASDRRGYSGTPRGAGGEPETSESCWSNGEARAKQEEKRLTNVTDRLLRSNQTTCVQSSRR